VIKNQDALNAKRHQGVWIVLFDLRKLRFSL